MNVDRTVVVWPPTVLMIVVVIVTDVMAGTARLWSQYHLCKRFFKGE